jgi:ATP-dependent DNA ligase
MTTAKRATGAGLPAGLAPPIKVALARVVTAMPRTTTQTGNLTYEPKWDGYRAIGVRNDNGATLWSRQGKDLTRYSVGVNRRRADVWPGESAVISARQVSLTCLSMSTSFRTTRTP